MKKPSRRDMIQLSSVGISTLLQSTASAQQMPNVMVRTTSANAKFQAGEPLKWRPVREGSGDTIVIDPATRFQRILGFGSSLTDSACYMLNQLEAGDREHILHELFHPSEMGFSISRIAVGASDYAASLYSYDEGDPDPDMRRFSIDHDKAYILPVLRQARAANPNLFLLASPWSPPGWMKAGSSMRGGSMLKMNFAAYARYFVKFLQSYSAEGVPVNAVTIQNEVDTDQDGRMPACLWGQEYEMAFVADHLGPRIEKEKLDTKIWILDHNYSLWGRAISELDEPSVSRYVDGVAWHGYVGPPSAMTRVHQAHPEKHMYWTEGGSDYTDPQYLTNWTRWGAVFAGILRNWARCIIGWNLALDEKGRPNIGPFPCGGLVTINSRTKEITRSGMYWAFAHYARAIRPGAQRIESHGTVDRVSHVAFVNTDKSTAVLLTNSGSEHCTNIRLGSAEVEVTLPANSITTLMM